MPDVEELLRTAGERWRAGQPGELATDPIEIVGTRRTARVPARGIVAMAAVIVVAAVTLAGRGGRLDGGGGLLGSAPGTSPAGRDTCPVTRPNPPFVPPQGYPATPGVSGSGWYGSAALWTLLGDDGEDWTGLLQTPAGLPQKTFWWSADWLPAAEPEPAIAVSARRLDETGAVTFGPGTNASASDIGTAMLVGIFLPDAGCWEIDARYRSAELSYVAWVGPPMAAPTTTAAGIALAPTPAIQPALAPTPAIQPAPTPTSTPAPVATPGSDATEARNIAMKYEDSRTAPYWNLAWDFLAPFSQQRIGSLADFISLETAYNESGGTTYEVGEAIAGPFDETIAGYIGSDLLADAASSGVAPGRTYLVYVTHPDVDAASAGTTAYVIAQVGDVWRIWLAH